MEKEESRKCFILNTGYSLSEYSNYKDMNSVEHTLGYNNKNIFEPQEGVAFEKMEIGVRPDYNSKEDITLALGALRKSSINHIEFLFKKFVEQYYPEVKYEDIVSYEPPKSYVKDSFEKVADKIEIK